MAPLLLDGLATTKNVSRLEQLSTEVEVKKFVKQLLEDVRNCGLLKVRVKHLEVQLGCLCAFFSVVTMTCAIRVFLFLLVVMSHYCFFHFLV